MHSSPGDFQPALLKKADRLRISNFFLFKDTMGEDLGCVILKHGTGALQNNRAIVVFLINEMDGATGDLAAVGQDGLVNLSPVHSAPAEAGQKRGVNVDHAILISRGNVEHAIICCKEYWYANTELRSDDARRNYRYLDPAPSRHSRT